MVLFWFLPFIVWIFPYRLGIYPRPGITKSTPPPPPNIHTPVHVLNFHRVWGAALPSRFTSVLLTCFCFILRTKRCITLFIRGWNRGLSTKRLTILNWFRRHNFKVGQDVSEEEAQEAARKVAIQLMATIKSEKNWAWHVTCVAKTYQTLCSLRGFWRFYVIWALLFLFLS